MKWMWKYEWNINMALYSNTYEKKKETSVTFKTYKQLTSVKFALFYIRFYVFAYLI